VNRAQVAKLKAPARAPLCDPDVVPGQGTRPCRQAHRAARHSRRRIPPMATSAPSSRWEDPESASPRAGTEALDPPLSSAGAMPALSHLTEQALHRAGHDRAQKARLCVATVAQSTCPRSTPNAGSARGYQGADRSLSRTVCSNR